MADPVWLMVMFDLPVKTSEQRNAANAFRNQLLDLGFSKVQLSVYAMYFLNASQSERVLKKVQSSICAGGAVRVLRFSDATWSSQKRFEGPGFEKDPEEKPSQLLLFE
ncbi:CRISPR-associated endonuclease Cas2 [Auritidibacter ignavus]|uniref:CRISPR-associated endonuclease Cas2 n=1 Tax=Auritidibacter ignavus TaxID=678932 RepID=UPI00109D557B|nr:CRISPR-associated endonuclease Cas2 [Auritidibacter ignavus]